MGMTHISKGSWEWSSRDSSEGRGPYFGVLLTRSQETFPDSDGLWCVAVLAGRFFCQRFLGIGRLAPSLWAGSSCSPKAFLAARMFPETAGHARACPGQPCQTNVACLSFCSSTVAGGSRRGLVLLQPRCAEPPALPQHTAELERLPLPHCPQPTELRPGSVLWAAGLHEEGSGLEASIA